MDQDANTGAPQDPQHSLNDPQSRRKFLRTAVIGAAGVAGGAAVVGVVLSRQSPGLLTGQFALGSGLSLRDPNASTCLTGSSFNSLTTDSSNPPNYLIDLDDKGNEKNNSAGTLFAWFTMPGLTGGTSGTQYDLSLSYDTTALKTKGSNPFFRYVYTDPTNHPATQCPSSDPVGGTVTKTNEGCVDGSGCVFPYTVPAGATYDLQFYAHLDFLAAAWPGTGNTHTYTITFTLTTPSQVTPVATGTITIIVTGV